MNNTIWTIGHSTRPIDEFIKILKIYNIEKLIDIRTIPRSRTNPQFNKDELEQELLANGISYLLEKQLGGLRPRSKNSPNTAWKNKSFQGFADYMQTDSFQKALSNLIEMASSTRCAIMCAEVLPWRCHRSLISDALMINGFEVIEIFDDHTSRNHKLTSFILVENGNITYPDTTDSNNKS